MDLAGFTIGAASLLTLFKTCLELYETIECGRNLATDYEVLATKVGIERVRLALWGSMVGLYDLPKDEEFQKRDTAEVDEKLDLRLGDPRIVRAVSDILNCMRRLFEDTGSLTRKYGLKQMPSGSLRVTTRDNPLKTTFKRTYALLQASASRIQQSSSLLAARWAIADKKRFQQFVDDLRGFNDSLALLFPDVSANARTTMVSEIKEATDLDGVQLVEYAVSDLNGAEVLAEAASLRITELSQYSKSTAGSTATVTTEEKIGDVNVQQMVRQMQMIEVSMSKRVELRGSLMFCLSSTGNEYFAKYVFYGISNEDLLVERQRKIEYVSLSYQAWSLMYMSDKKRHDQCDFSQQDIECLRTLQGKYPGTHTVDGYIAELNMWILNSTPTSEHRFNTIRDLPDISFEDLTGRVRRIRLQGDRFWHFNDRSPDQEVTKLIGPIRSGPRLQDQVIDLLSTLNRRRVFPDVRDESSLCAMALSSTSSLYKFLYQVILAHELRIRMLQLPDDAFGNMSHRIVAAIQVSERWIDGIDVRIPDPKRRPDYVELHSYVHERQVEGLVKFAEAMAWPAIGEMRRFAEEAYAGIQAGRNTDVYLTDWLFGLLLPGKMFIYNIMTSLVAATPSLKHLGNARYYNSGLVAKDRSYWQAKSVLGRVLGAMKGARATNGWVGPFPRPTGPQSERIEDGWWHVHARNVGFNRFMPGDQPAEGGRFPRFQHRKEETSESSWVRGLGDRSKWVVPLPPDKSSDEVKLCGLRFTKIGPLNGASYDGPECQDENEPEQRATLELSINDQPVQFTLYSNPVFVAAPKCVDGPHAVHEQDFPKTQHILRVSQLSTHVHNDSRVLIIDATEKGECELAARAWCAENGQHAVLVRGHGTCLACAVKTASQGALAIGCVIWAGL